MRLLKREYTEVEESLTCLRGLEVEPILKEWGRREAVTIKKVTIGFKEAILILGLSSSKLKGILAEVGMYKPISMMRVLEIQRRERSKFSLIDDNEFAAAKSLIKSFFNVSPAPPQIPMDTTLAQQLRKSLPGESEVESLLKKPTTKESATIRTSNEITALIQAPTAKEKIINSQFKTRGGIDTKRICPYAMRNLCKEMNYGAKTCELVHFRRFVQSHTDEALGDCPMLAMCTDMDRCARVHYVPETGNNNVLY
eukprot:TRINITY_DN10397_c0_g2_i19.p2 TRINITY_DN10397_c0_g2~~TRINITY_DN10397_c0_g2_i19.p2  ORF type:complete len:254 (-),score=82.41 TRINITY_DN10397_c0_g2_i19:729-1490(-)